MSSDTPSSEIRVDVVGPHHRVQIRISTDKTVLELKQAVTDRTDVPVDDQRLLFRGRILKDEDLISVYRIQSSHTIHMIQKVAMPAKPSSSAGASAVPAASTQPLPSMQTDQKAQNPSEQLRSHTEPRATAGVNPFADMGFSLDDPDVIQKMMNSPEFLQRMGSMLSNPQVMEQVIAQNPQLQQRAPQIREQVNSPMFRQMMSNPDNLRTMMQMSGLMQGAGGTDTASTPFEGSQ